MKMLEESLTVTCVGPTDTRKELEKLLHHAGVRSEGADLLAKLPNGLAVICEMKVHDVLEHRKASDNWATWERAFLPRLKYFRSAAAHELMHVLLFSGSSSSNYVDVVSSLVAHMEPKERSWLHFVRTPEDAVAQVILSTQARLNPGRIVSTLDGIPEIQAINNDLRGEDGQLNAEKVKAVFGLDTMSEMAKSAGISRQALDANPSTRAVIPVLEQLEQVARIRALKQLKEPEAFKAWWKRRLPALKNRSPYETWKTGDVQSVVELADSLITGDSRG